MTLLYLDCSSGIAGDMALGALIELGVPLDVLDAAFEQLGFPDLRVVAEKRDAGHGITGTHVTLQYKGEHAEKAAPDGLEHGHWVDIRERLQASRLAPKPKQLALDLFGAIAVAEAEVHGVAVDDVHFHEVGALDSIGDIVGVAVGIDYLDIDEVVCSPLPMGRGFTSSMHGRIPLPAPATLLLTKGVAIVGVDEEFEFVTPTGAAIVKVLARRFGPLPTMTVKEVGHGVGTKKLQRGPNVLRAVLGESGASAGARGSSLRATSVPGSERNLNASAEARGGSVRDSSEPSTIDGLLVSDLVELHTNLDDMSPEHFGHLRDRLFALAKANDVWWSGITMKDGRPGVALSVLCDLEHVELARGLIFSESTTLGLRETKVRRFSLQRHSLSVTTPFGEVRLKLGRRGSLILTVAPEYQDARRAAEAQDVPIKRVFDEAHAAGRALGIYAGASFDELAPELVARL
ncbi:MAG: TIGR00299 family protein, partial [Deltaproteobacteria bacterium CG17_big_fil_post_rev_8_21_14_2_50_63_7]